MCITDLGLGKKAIITAIDATDPHVQRLMVLGFVEGAIVEHVSRTSSALEFKLHDSRFAFSAEQAQHFTVEPV